RAHRRVPRRASRGHHRRRAFGRKPARAGRRRSVSRGRSHSWVPRRRPPRVPIPLPKSIKDMAGGLAVGPLLNPIPACRQVHQPVLLIYGERDYLVDAVESPVHISEALIEGGHAPPTVLTFEAADHSIRVTETGRPSEVLKELRW